MQILIITLLSLFMYSQTALAEGGGSGMGNGGGPGQLLMTSKSFSGQSGGGHGSLVVTLEGAVDVRLKTGEVLDVQELKDRFTSDVTKVGDDVRITTKIPVADFQNIRGEVRQIQQLQQIQN